MKIISLGAGVQSSSLFLMSCLGELPKADCAIFADTQREPSGVYKHLAFLKEQGEKHNIPIYTVSTGDLGQDTLDHAAGDRKRAASIPFFVDTGKGTEGRAWRQCTNDYKIAPLRRMARDLAAGGRIEMWIGISTDEIRRAKDSGVKDITHIFPLLERRMSRQDCLSWYTRNGFPQPARSACTFCPYRKDHEWQRIKETDPEAFQEAVEFDEAVRNMPKMNGTCYLHRSLRPLAEIDFTNPADKGQMDFGFEEECEGMCGI